MAFQNPSVQDFKDYFFRDFPYGSDIETSVTDQDIAKAYQQTNVNINEGLFDGQSAYTVGYLLLSAHYLVMDLRASSQGISGQFSWTEQSKSVGNVAQAFAIPQRILDNALWSLYTQTTYGAQYLQLILPSLSGQVFISYGSTRP